MTLIAATNALGRVLEWQDVLYQYIARVFYSVLMCTQDSIVSDYFEAKICYQCAIHSKQRLLEFSSPVACCVLLPNNNDAFYITQIS